MKRKLFDVMAKLFLFISTFIFKLDSFNIFISSLTPFLGIIILVCLISDIISIEESANLCPSVATAVNKASFISNKTPFKKSSKATVNI